MSRIALDARWIFEKRSGIGVHTRELIRQFAAIAPPEDILLLFESQALRERTQAETGHGFESLMLPYGLFSIANQHKLARTLRARDVDVYHSTNYMLPLIGRMPPSVTTIHDLIPLLLPHHAPKSRKSKVPGLFRWILRRAARRSGAIIAVSESTKTDITAHLGVRSEDVHVVYNGVDEVFCPGTGPTEPPYLLYVGRFDPYKNVPRLVEAFAALRADFPRLHLRVVGSPDERYPETQERVSALGLDEVVHVCGGVGTEQLVSEYQGASVLVLASDYEGFGLPVAEAMACGVPVVCGNRSALPEIVGDAALTVNPDSTPEIAAAIARILKDEDLQETLRSRGLERAKNYSWNQAAEQTLGVYRQTAQSVGL